MKWQFRPRGSRDPAMWADCEDPNIAGFWGQCEYRRVKSRPDPVDPDQGHDPDADCLKVRS